MIGAHNRTATGKAGAMYDEPVITLTDDDISALNAARTVLDRIDWKVGGSCQLGMIHAKANTASEAIFDFLNWSDAYGNVPVTREQMHNTTDAEVLA